MQEIRHLPVIYTLFLYIYSFVIRVASLGNPKAKAWIEGRRHWRSKLRSKLINPKENQCVWIHCASLGEFEQGRPVIEAIRAIHPSVRIHLTFFSPSGYEVRKQYDQADAVSYLPLDSLSNARDFLDIVKPDLVIFVKYEYWSNFLREINRRQLPFLLISAIFRPRQVFFRWYGAMFRESLRHMTTLFVQDEASRSWLNTLGVKRSIVAGDTRFDRVVSIRNQFQPIPEAASFVSGRPTVVAGSTWGPDEEMLAAVARRHPELAFIIVPHEIHEEHLKKTELLFPTAIRFSNWKANGAIDKPQTLIIDNIGMLSRLYHYATICYVGGGFGAGIHNTLEAAAHGKPVLFGPRYHKFREAIELIEKGAGFHVGDPAQLDKQVSWLLENEHGRIMASEQAYLYVQQQSGATAKIIDFIQENRLLTS